MILGLAGGSECYPMQVQCLTIHSEAEQTETLDFGAEKGLLQGHAKRQVDCAPK